MNAVDRIKELCFHKRVSIAKLERDLGFSNGYISGLKDNKIPSDRLLLIADYFDVSVNYILGIEDGKKPLVNNDEELTDYLQTLKDRPEMKMLFDITKKATKEDVEAVVTLFERMIGKGNDE